MSGPRRDKEYLSDVREAMHRVVAYVQGLTFEEFMNDAKTQDAVIRNLQVMGDAIKKLSSRLREAHPEIPWREIAGMRDKVVHEYFGINYDIVWTVVDQEVPMLLLQIDDIADQESRE
jgi:uncharacterized protein with HEPN domain